MSKILLFGGTSEGRMLSEWLCEKNAEHDLCVATQYGEQVLREHPCVKVFRGRMDEKQIEDFMREMKSEIVIDGTHPYASAVTENIKKAAARANVRYLRLDRGSEAGHGEGSGQRLQARKLYFENAAECAKALKDTDGNILLTTGSKELSVYGKDISVRERLVVRVLPGKESIDICDSHQIPGKQIIAMQGPFSCEMNRALIHAYDIRIIVSKISGRKGGFPEKEMAAALENIPLYLIGRTDSSHGLSFEQVKAELGSYVPAAKRRISLISCGMGHRINMTEESLKALDGTDIVFGAPRFLENALYCKEKYPYYLSGDIIPVLKKTKGDAAVLFSGDTGLFSGASKLYCALKEEQEFNAEIKVYPGVSSAANLAALCGISWDDANIISIHGKGTSEERIGKVLKSVRENKKTFIILSGVKDLNDIGKALEENGLKECTIRAGYQMSYPEEKVLELTPYECTRISEEGLYALFILNECPEGRIVTYGIPDHEFIRGKVPMTKEEVREVSISKLGLRSRSVVYDIGSGTGSLAVEMARLSPDIKVYAIERKPEAAELIRNNVRKFGLANIEVVETYAPQGLRDLERPTHAFIGGSGGNMKEIIGALFEKNPHIRVCANAVSIETFEELINIERQFSVEDFSIVSMSVTRTRKVGAYNMLQAENPIWICSFKGR